MSAHQSDAHEVGQAQRGIVAETSVGGHQRHDAVIVYLILLTLVVVRSYLFCCGLRMSDMQSWLVQAVAIHHVANGK